MEKVKLITLAIPSYNSQAYLHKCIDSLLVAAEDIEILVINDGSTDNTAAIAQEYVQRYPDTVRLINKENGGHGSGVNCGLAEATGLYYKVVDSDDWLDGDTLLTLIATMKRHIHDGEAADLYITNFVYEHVEDGTCHVSEYTKHMPVDRFFGWSEIKPLKRWKMLLMHSLIYKTEKVRKSGIVLPEHTFYVDNLYAYQPLPYMKKLYYLNIDLYRYYIGRVDQSVSYKNMIARYDQQIRVMNCMLEAYTYDEIRAMSKPLAKQMLHILEIIMLNTIFFTTAADSPERRQMYKMMWMGLYQRDKKLYKKLRHHTHVKYLNPMTWKTKGWVTTVSYRLLCKFIKLGA